MTPCERPCNDCPFRRRSLPGWLGPWEPTELVQSLEVAPFPCHRTIKGGGQRFDDPALRLCAGAAIFLNNRVARSRDPVNRAAQDALRDVPDAVKQSVFARSDEFIAHHMQFRLRRTQDADPGNFMDSQKGC